MWKSRNVVLHNSIATGFSNFTLYTCKTLQCLIKLCLTQVLFTARGTYLICNPVFLKWIIIMGIHSNWSIGPLQSSTNAKLFTALGYIKALPTA